MFKKLLVPLDGSPLAEHAIGVATTIARPSAAKIDLLMVHQPVPFAGFADAPWSSAHVQFEETYLEAAAIEMNKEAPGSVTHELVRGDVIESICDRAREENVDLIVMTSHGRTGFSRLWFGSIADGVLRGSAVPVLMLPLSEGDNKAQVMKPIRNILVTLDGSILGDSILPVAVDLARSVNAKLTLLTVVQPVPMLIPESVGTFASSAEVPDESATRYVVGEATKQLTEHEKALSKDGFTNVETKVIVAPKIARTILEFAAEKRVDAVALSTHGRGASRLLLGSIADKIIRAAKLPVLVHRPASVEKMNELINTSKLELELPALTVY